MFEIEINKECKKSNDEFVNKNGRVVAMITPAIDEDYYVMRIHMVKDQYINAFPKFGQIGIGFAIENDDWNANLPAPMNAMSIAKHIQHNKKYKKITLQNIMEGIDKLQHTLEDYGFLKYIEEFDREGNRNRDKNGKLLFDRL